MSSGTYKLKSELAPEAKFLKSDSELKQIVSAPQPCSNASLTLTPFFLVKGQCSFSPLTLKKEALMIYSFKAKIIYIKKTD
jgi:hypothetical protein